MTRSQASSIATRIAEIQNQLPASVRLVAVTKQVAVSAMREAYEAGIRDFGESRIQEAIAKQEQLNDLPDIHWHLIGHLQSNKAAKAIQHFDWIHSVDSLKLAQRLNQLAAEQNSHPNVLLQVKLRPDPDKYGWEPETLRAELGQLDECSHLNILGLMAIPPLGLSDSETLSYFLAVHDFAAEIRQMPLHHIQMKELSMGMSGDYPLALQAGSSMIRPGRILFGERV